MLVLLFSDVGLSLLYESMDLLEVAIIQQE
jgi:hypothetical protein